MNPFSIVGVTAAVSFFIGAVDFLGLSLRLWKKNSRTAVTIRFLLYVSSVALSLAGAYMIFFDMAERVFSALKVLAVWDDKLAVWMRLAKQLILPAVIIFLTPMVILLDITRWARCPYCRRFPVRRQPGLPGNSWTWSCRAHPEAHYGPVGKHWWSTPQKREAQ